MDSQARCTQSVMSRVMALPSMEKSTMMGSSGGEVETKECCSFQRRAMSLVTCAPLYFGLDFLYDLAVHVVAGEAGCIWSPGPGMVRKRGTGRSYPHRCHDEGVFQHVEGVGHSEGFGDDLAAFTEPQQRRRWPSCRRGLLRPGHHFPGTTRS
ncbi:MAG: hypothetical protein CM15mP18_4980 [Methanobacteriota archaeon]|nr:MAG: hypothetical protein CM15mP18_4980 [Euryarchaeota archaeon]